MKKDELTKENGKLGLRINRLEQEDGRLREQFSLVMNAPIEEENGTYFRGSRNRALYSWEEIFAEVGKLLELRGKEYNLIRIKELEKVVRDLQYELEDRKS